MKSGEKFTRRIQSENSKGPPGHVMTQALAKKNLELYFCSSSFLKTPKQKQTIHILKVLEQNDCCEGDNDPEKIFRSWHENYFSFEDRDFDSDGQMDIALAKIVRKDGPGENFCVELVKYWGKSRHIFREGQAGCLKIALIQLLFEFRISFKSGTAGWKALWQAMAMQCLTTKRYKNCSTKCTKEWGK